MTEPCRAAAHDPPAHRVYLPGLHVHRCPACGVLVRFTVRKEVTL